MPSLEYDPSPAFIWPEYDGADVAAYIDALYLISDLDVGYLLGLTRDSLANPDALFSRGTPSG